MKFRTHSLRPLAAALLVLSPHLSTAQAPDAPPQPDEAALESLGKAAGSFVAAFNAKDADAITALFLPAAEMTGRDGTVYRGSGEIADRYREIFAREVVPQVSLEASSVHLVSPGVAIEEGTVHFTTAGEEPVISIAYTATQIRQDDGTWRIASSRDREEVTPPAERLKPLARLAGEWTYEGDESVRTELAIDFDDSGNFLLGEAVATDETGSFQTTTLRIGWNPATRSIHWWTFDSDGGNATGTWTRDGATWVIRTSGITADAETSAAVQRLSFDGDDTIVWASTARMLGGESLPDAEIRFVRRAPDASPEEAEETPADE